MNQEKKIIERHILDQFKGYYPDFPKGKVVPSESPDFIIRSSPKRSIGIELSSLPSSTYQIHDKADLEDLLTAIQTTISRKENKIKLYKRKHAAEYWLVIHVDSIQAGGFNWSNHIKRITHDSAFARICLFDLFDGRIIFIP